MEIVFRVDASVEIGTGHVMRCITLAEKLFKSGANITFICRDHPGNLCEWIKKKGFKVICLKRPQSPISPFRGGDTNLLGVTQLDDAEETFLHLKAIGGCEWLVVDHYHLDSNWEKFVGILAKKIMVIDDLENRFHECEILLDQNYHIENESRYAKLVPEYCQKLLGPEFAILRPEFLNNRILRLEDKPKNKKLMIFYGGTDSGNETLKALKAIKSMGRNDIYVDVIFGKNYPFKRASLDFAFEMSNVICHNFINNMASLMAKADLYLGAAGVTTWERCCIGLPSVVISVANNQIQPMKHLQEAGVVNYLGVGGEVGIDQIASTVESLIDCPSRLFSMRERALLMVDGHGAQRCAMAIMNYGDKNGKKLQNNI